ncbi:inner membrane protein [Psychrobacter sp. PL19]|uniref:metal-dependent hydrolase n=1 Tax=Psychrobacter sp. PL19 TaxID=2760711 RepID=UPI001AE387E7
MDSLSQIVLGASVQGAILGKYQGRKAYIYGAILGTIPDLDVILNYGDPVSNMTYHRGFSHSLFVLTALGLGGAWLISRYHQWRGIPLPYSDQRLALAMTLALTTHPILDSFTVYGTQLFWPLQEPLQITPISIASVFIIDPLYTLPLLIAMIIGLIKGRKLPIFKKGWFANCQRLAVGMLVVSSGYLLLSLGLKYYAQGQAEQTLAAAGIEDIVRIKTMPVLPTTLLWRTLAEDKQHRIIELRGSVLDKRLPEYRYLTKYKNSKALSTNLPQSSQPYATRLDWFSGDWTGYRTQTLIATNTIPKQSNTPSTEQLVVDDLRMVAGDTSFFSFVLATSENQKNISAKKNSSSPSDNPQWQAIIPIETPFVSIDDKPKPSRFNLIKQGFHRVIDESAMDADGGWELVD